MQVRNLYTVSYKKNYEINYVLVSGDSQTQRILQGFTV